MLTFNKINDLQSFLSEKTITGLLGFVPTMGALHEGHISLIRRAKAENDIVVCSIFVNPIQFNNPQDLEKYPRTLGKDCEMLSEAGCDVLFNPSEKEMYPEPVHEEYRFGLLDQVMEGRFRPGHFKGVAIVVKRLFEIVKPHKAYFGEKDYQQLLVVKEMVRQKGIPVEIIPCAIVREPDGLAMSSRNIRLSPSLRTAAPVIYQTLRELPAKRSQHSVTETIRWAIEQIEAVNPLKVEYLEISDALTLSPASHWDDFPSLIACIAVWAGDVRLIDNILIL